MVELKSQLITQRQFPRLLYGGAASPPTSWEEIDGCVIVWIILESEREKSQFESHSFMFLHTMDHYKVLGLNRSATKDEIKEAFRKLAMKFHPDKHSLSSKSVRESATVKFKQVSEAYDVLIDDRKRADYNLRSGFGSRGSGSGFSGGYGYGYYSGSSYRPRYQSGSAANGDGWVSRFDIFFQYLRTRAFLLNLAFAR